MSRAISRDSFSELKNYLGVYLQQGRPILDADWNENQDIVVAALRRLVRDALGDGSPNHGFAIEPLFPPLVRELLVTAVEDPRALGDIVGALLGFLEVPAEPLEDFESPQGFALAHPQGQPPPPGQLRLSRDRPYQGTGFLRLSGHLGPVQAQRTLPAVKDLSAYELATFRFRLNHRGPGTMKFFLEDDDGNRSVWLRDNPALAQDLWLPGLAAPLDLSSFRILTERLPAAVKNAESDYSAWLFTFGGRAPMQWTVSAGRLPDGLTIPPPGDVSRLGTIIGTPAESGSFTFTVKVTDGGGRTTEKQLTLEVRDAGPVPQQFLTPAELLSLLGRSEAPTGTAADLTAIRSYGFGLYQDETIPLIWDLDDLQLVSGAAREAAARNNFIIRGSEPALLLNQLAMLTALLAGGEVGVHQGLLDFLDTELELAEPSVENAGRMYVGGLPCLQVEDVLYSEQADPDQAPLTPPPSGEVRWDTVYLDVWTEPVTYVQDPAIREVALGGPDTATRQAVRHRVRVAQDGGTPKGNGIGGGTLATEGSYMATANRLYLVEIDTAGNIGEQATFRWSGENAATIQRVIEPVPEGSIEVTVEDAAAFHKGDLLLLRTELGSERHEVASVLANVITLVTPTATAFSLADRPMLQRWNAFQVPIPPDPADASVSRAIDLDDGVRVRFGGRDLRMGDSWSFTTRYLAGDDVSGIDPVTRIERLDFQPASGVVHHYAPLAVITRHGDREDPDQILEVQDRRGRVGTRTAVGFLPDHEVIVREGTYHLGGLRLPTGARASKLFAFWWADMTLINPPQAGFLTVRLSFYSDEMRDPATDPDTGRIERREAMVALGEREQFNALPLYLRFAEGSPGFALPLLSPVSTSLQVFATLNLPDSGFELFLINMQVMAIERTDG